MAIVSSSTPAVVTTCGIALTALALTTTFASRAHACGGTPVGPSAIALSCAHPDADAVEPEEPPPPNLRVGVQMGWSALDHDFSQGGELRRRTLTATIGWRPIDTITLHGDVGAIIDGDITIDERRYVIDPGMRAGLGIAWRAFHLGDDDDGPWPFVLFAAKLSVLSSTTSREDERLRLTQLDFRSSISVGRLFGDGPSRLGPYLVARSLTGALYWDVDGRIRSVQPADLFQIGLGAIARGGPIDAFFEVVPFGERAAVVGVGGSF